jgi:separase
MAPTRVDTDAIIQAVSSTTSASTATITTLQHILGVLPPSTDRTAVSKGPATGRTNGATSKTAAARPRAKSTVSKTVANVKILTEDPPILSAKDRLVLATQIVNTAIRTISDASKKTATNYAKSNPASPIQKRARPLTVRSPNSPDKRANAKKPTVNTPTINSQSTVGIAAVAECARIAFGYVRAHGKQVAVGTLDAPLEKGTLSFIGKCLSLGLDSTAVKELRALKRRLDLVLDPVTATKKSSKTAPTEKELWTNLLEFGTTDNNVVTILTKHQTYVAKLTLKKLNHGDVDFLLKQLDLTRDESPINLMLRQAEESKDPSQYIRQVESFLGGLVGACPSVSVDADEEACNPHKSITPSATLRIHAIVWQSRALLAGIDGRIFDLEKDFWRPLSKCFAAYVRRAQASADKKYSLAKSIFDQLTLILDQTKVGTSKNNGSSFTSQIILSLSSLAQSASMNVEAVQWVEQYQNGLLEPEIGTVNSAVGAVRLASLNLQFQTATKLSSIMTQAHATMITGLRGDSSELDLLLLEIAGYRRTLMATILSENKDEALASDCRNGIYSCIRFLLRYVGKPLEGDTDIKSLARQNEKLNKARKAAPGFTDSVFHCCKVAVKDSSINWRDFDSALEDCLQLVSNLEQDEDNSKYCKSNVAVKASSLYWAFYRFESAKSSNVSVAGIRALKRSVAVLKSEASQTRENGQYTLKLEQLARLHSTSQNYDSCFECLQTIMMDFQDRGIVESLAELANKSSYDTLWGTESGMIIGKFLEEFLSLIQQADRSERPCPGFYDHAALDAPSRALLLERQLVSYTEDIVKPGHLRQASQIDRVSETLSTLLEICDKNQFPIRRQRLILLCSRFVHVFSPHLDHQFDKHVEEVSATEQKIMSSKDRQLLGYQEHLQLSIKLNQILAKPSRPKGDLEHVIQSWTQLLGSSTHALSTRIDHTPLFINNLSLLSELCEIQCMPTLQILALNLLENVLSAQRIRDHTLIADTLSTISLLYLRIGYSGAAGLTLARTKSIISIADVSSESILRHHLAYAEYFLALGATSKCEDSLQLAETIVKTDPKVAITNTPTLTRLIRTNKLICHALEITSALNLKHGYPAAALKDAKRCIKLLQRSWAALENDKISPSAVQESSGLGNSELGVSVLNAPASISRSITHDALKGARMWYLIPSLIRAYQHISSIYKHHGMFSESLFWIDSAQKVISIIPAPASQLYNFSLLAEHHIENGDVETGQEFLDQAMENIEKVAPSMELVRHHQSVARMWKARNEVDDELEAFGAALETVDRMISQPPVIPSHSTKLSEDQLTEQMASMQIDNKKAPSKTVRTTRGKPAPTNATSRRKQPVVKALPQTTTQPLVMRNPECAPLSALQLRLLIDQVMAYLSKNDMTNASKGITRLEAINTEGYSTARKTIAGVRMALSETMKSVASDCTFGMLPESTISIPSLALSEMKATDTTDVKQSTKSGTASRVARAVSGRSVGKAKTTKKASTTGAELGMSLCSIRDELTKIQPLAGRVSSVAEYRELCSLLTSVSVFVSASTQHSGQIHVHSSSAALLIGKH